MSAIAGIDQATWDIKGKVLGQPVYKLLGGLMRDNIKVYSRGRRRRLVDVARDVKRCFDAFKMTYKAFLRPQ